ncbi:MAG: hypothetical protein HN849_00685 [Victivallales bacterium]|jgi:hypothetical protein|nr:hypothetical protein [Victivallales bacterium]
MSDLPSAKETQALRELARRVAEIAALPEQAEKAELWARHNDLEKTRPMVLVFPEGSWSELAADWVYDCETPLARRYEQDLRQRLYSWEHLRDDNVIEPVVSCPVAVRNTGYGLQAERIPSTAYKGAYHIEPVLIEESDLDKIQRPEVTVDWERTGRNQAQVREIFDGILEVRLAAGWGGWAPMDQLSAWRGIDQLYLDLIERPQWVHAVMQRLLDGKLGEIEALEAQGALRLNNRNHYNGSGGVGYTAQLPAEGYTKPAARCRDLWAMATAQIFSEVSPSMHEEFALTYERQFLERFGLANYGCCEPLHHKLDAVLKIRNLRRVSISPWADLDQSAERLQNRYVFSWKPNPAIVAGPTWRPEPVRAGLRDFCERTRGCVTDIIMKDTHTCNHEPRRLQDWVRIAMETAREFTP